MKKILFLIFAIICCCPYAAADDIDLPSAGEMWENWNKSQDFYGQNKPIVSDEDFDKALETVKNRKDKIGSWLKKRKIPRGKEIRQSNETEIINEKVGNKEFLPVICVPLDIHIGEGVLPVGHYQVEAEKNEDGNIDLNFYQAQYLMAKIPAVETLDDFGEDTISFVKWIPMSEDKAKIIYGSMDYNAYAVIEIK